VYNEAGSIVAVRAQLARLAPDCDVLFIDDGSLDGSGALLEAAGCDVVHHPVNLGYLEALRTGLTVALAEDYDFVVFFDGDGQHQVEDLNKLVEHHRAHPQDDLLIGSRYFRGQRAGSWLRHLVGQSYALVVRLVTGQVLYDVTSGLKLLNRRAMAIMNGLVLEDGHAEFLVFMVRSGCRVRELSIHVEPRRQGTSMYRISKMFIYPLKTSFLLLLALLTSRPSGREHP
jgi:glycosyltransferase involved in cell wall biosynthesis